MFHKRPEKDTVNPPGQIVNRPSHFEQPLTKEIEAYEEDVGNGEDKVDWPDRPPYIYVPQKKGG